MSRRLKNKPANIICDEEFLKEFPYFNRKIKVNETEKIKRLEAIIYPSDNDKILIDIILERKTKKIVIDSSDHEENKKRMMIQRKNKESIDEISQGLLIKQKNDKKCSKKNCKSEKQKEKKAKEKQK